ncbi:hypothetical protein KCP76_14960 [Salmonella enterica subsp. enterica serovar Weltevreden]|nr:hypothetical protein KCP76_14960 [Salmonella enterica subsp. enterica serovar Weltevreden]
MVKRSISKWRELLPQQSTGANLVGLSDSVHFYPHPYQVRFNYLELQACRGFTALASSDNL